MIDYALAYVKAGFPVFPCCWPGFNGNCACGGKHEPKNTGKVPLTAHGLKDATLTIQGVREYWTKWPKANIGIAVPKGYFVLDIDVLKDGYASLEQMQMKYDAIPETLQITTGTGGAHFWYKTPREIRNTAQLAGYQGIDVRGWGGYVIAPPSVHRNGIAYQKSPVWDGEITLAPDWLIELCSKRDNSTSTQGRLTEGVRNDTLTRIAGGMRRNGMSPDAIHAALKVHNDQQGNPPLSDTELWQIAKSIGRYAPEHHGPSGGAIL